MRRARFRTGWALPCTRGWTRLRQAVQGRERGSSVYARMDPAPGQTRRQRPGLFRVRADGPMLSAAFTSRSMALPCTRGWTAEALQEIAQRFGSSVYARMDPTGFRRRPSALRLFRVRADGPVTETTTYEIPGALPCTRGWTLVDIPVHISTGGSAVHARMDPSSRRAEQPTSRLFRVRAGSPRYRRTDIAPHRLFCPRGS